MMSQNSQNSQRSSKDLFYDRMILTQHEYKNPAFDQPHSKLFQRVADKDPHEQEEKLRNQKVNPNRIDLDAHEREHRPERFPKVHNIPKKKSVIDAYENSLRPWYYRVGIPQLFYALFGVLTSGYDTMNEIGNGLADPNYDNKDNEWYDQIVETDEPPELFIRISYSIVQIAQNLIGFILKTFFFPHVTSLHQDKGNV